MHIREWSLQNKQNISKPAGAGKRYKRKGKGRKSESLLCSVLKCVSSINMQAHPSPLVLNVCTSLDWSLFHRIEVNGVQELYAFIATLDPGQDVHHIEYVHHSYTAETLQRQDFFEHLRGWGRILPPEQNNLKQLHRASSRKATPVLTILGGEQFYIEVTWRSFRRVELRTPRKHWSIWVHYSHEWFGWFDCDNVLSCLLFVSVVSLPELGISVRCPSIRSKYIYRERNIASLQ